MFLFLGDNIYGDTEDMVLLKTKWEELGAIKDYQKLRETTPVLATWDGHDNGINDRVSLLSAASIAAFYSVRGPLPIRHCERAWSFQLVIK